MDAQEPPIAYRIAVGPQAGRKVFILQTLPTCDESFDDGAGKVAGFSLHAGVAAKAHERKKLERLCRYIPKPAVSEKRLLLTPNGNIRYPLKTPCRDGTTQAIFEPRDFNCPARRPGSQARSQADALARGVCPQLQTSRLGDPGQAGQREQGEDTGRTANARRTASLDHLGAKIKACVQHRYGNVSRMRRRRQSDRRHRRPGGDPEDIRSPEGKG